MAHAESDEKHRAGPRALVVDFGGVLTNSIWECFDAFCRAEGFDAIVISAEVSLRKPQPQIYLLVAERLGVESRDCIYVDDLRENCEAAEAVGMTAILHRDPNAILACLEERLSIPLRSR